jgi:hypothetical protein
LRFVFTKKIKCDNADQCDQDLRNKLENLINSDPNDHHISIFHKDNEHKIWVFVYDNDGKHEP